MKRPEGSARRRPSAAHRHAGPVLVLRLGGQGLSRVRRRRRRVEVPNSRYLLYGGDITRGAVSTDGGAQSPNLWWPDDRAWIVATEVDYCWTYLGGSQALVDELVADTRVEALAVRLSDDPFALQRRHQCGPGRAG
jgi:hypothetical protein